MNVDPNILIVIATVVSVFAATSTIAGWVERVWPISALIALAIGLGLLALVHLSLPEGLRPIDIPNAFIHVAAMILG